MLNKITLHWTAGGNIPNEKEMRCYHYLIDTKGLVYKGIYAPEDNINCKDGKYAAHTGGGNTGNIGVSFCGCYIPKGTPVRNSKYPLTRIQVERGFKLVAEIAKKYNIPIDKEHVFTHYEFGLAHPKTESAGKIDIIYMAPFPDISAKDCGDFIRNKIKWYYTRL